MGLVLYHLFDRDVDPRDSIQHASFLVLSCVSPAKCHRGSCCWPALLHSILVIRVDLCKTIFCVVMRGSVPRCPSAVLFSKCYEQQSSQFCQDGVSRDHEYMWLSESGVS